MSVSLYGSGQTVLQVVSTILSSNFSTTSSSYTNVTGLAATITPQSTTSKILVIATTSLACASGVTGAQITRNGTPIGVNSNGTTYSGTFPVTGYNNGNVDSLRATSVTILDSPSTTSAVSYQVQVVIQSGSGSLYVNTNNSNTAAGSSSITLLEISGS